MMVRFEHENVVAVIGTYFSFDSKFIMVTEFCKYGSLKDFID